MRTVALIGADGAGKTSVARHVVETAPFPVRYVYMGISAQSGGHHSPMTKIVLAVRRWNRRTRAPGDDATSRERIPAVELEYSTRQRAAPWVAARLLNRFVEAWYRQLIAWYHVLLGRVVIFDRHLLFDTGLLKSSRGSSLVDRAYRRAMRFFPKPELVIFMDAPGEVLYARSGDASPGRLDEERRLYASQANAVRRFVTIDASLPLEEVERETMASIGEWLDVPVETAQ